MSLRNIVLMWGYEWNYGPGEPIYVMMNADGRYWNGERYQIGRFRAIRYTMKQTFWLSLVGTGQWVQTGERYPCLTE